MPPRAKPADTRGRASRRRDARRQKQKEYQRKWRSSDKPGALADMMFHSAKLRAKREGAEFTITKQDVRDAIPLDGRCPVLGSPMQRGRGKAQDSSFTLDRVNPMWGYTPGNIAVISFSANRAKGSLTAEQLERIAQWMRAKGLS